MLKTIPPMDLPAACAECGTTLSGLSEETGIPEEELLSFGEGRSGLSAKDFFAIMMTLTEHLPDARSRAVSGSQMRSLEACRRLLREVEGEDREEELGETSSH